MGVSRLMKPYLNDVSIDFCIYLYFSDSVKAILDEYIRLNAFTE